MATHDLPVLTGGKLDGGVVDVDTLTDGTTKKLLTATERSKLGGIQANATANSADVALLSRTNHTGQQDYTTVVGLGTAATKDVGTTAGTVAAGNDSRFTNARTPVAHAASHASDGSDPVTLAVGQVTGLSAALASVAAAKGVYYLDAYTNFFNGWSWAAGQGITATTLTAQATAGTTTLSVASATGMVVGIALVTNPGTAIQQLLRVTAVVGNDLTVTPAVATTLANGAAVAPVWSDVKHPTNYATGGAKAYGYWAAEAKDSSGNYIFTGSNKTVVWLGDSWTSNLQCVQSFGEQLNARLGTTNVVAKGVSGNKLSDMIARWSTDVAPSNPNYVFIEYGVNDIYFPVSAAQMAAELDQVLALCRAIGAIAVLPGIPPLFDYPGISEDRNKELKAQVTAGLNLPATTMGAARAALPNLELPRNSTSFRLGERNQTNMTGVNNIAVGSQTQQLLTTGTANTAVGHNAQAKITTPSNNTAFGAQAQVNLTTGANNTAVGATTQNVATTAANNTSVGFNTLAGLTSGSFNVAVGSGAQTSPNNVGANATTTGAYQTCVGAASGQGSTAQVNLITTVGYAAVAAGSNATAIGAFTSAGGAGSVAIGVDNANTGASTAVVNEIALGTALHTTRIAGGLKLAAGTTARPTLNVPPGVAPTAPADGDIWTTTAGLFVRINGATVGPLT